MSDKQHWNIDEIRFCNCALCRTELVGLSNADEDLEFAKRKKIPIVAAQVRGRPYCQGCVRRALNS